MGKYHYFFLNSRGKISLINELRGYNNSPNFWEIYCLAGNLFEDFIEDLKETFEQAKDTGEEFRVDFGVLKK